ncbi:acylglycerol kinase family protein [Sphingomonas sp.]|jgi:diacylglycerol kinase family enzyme|uniref:diacylglycerol/lipid kinase family protein n=1 Tax=Sphingomonas sp. TaxID=28214 RepID=UPI002DBEEF3E|nr:acylglycerol kinase family protein [Sphingomonas sp.]HEU4969606.1 acylglycerol kinase family protein [Sphingomonas sp.]
MACVALLSNPRSTGNRALLPRVRAYCARNPDIFHYEVEEIGQIPDAMRTIARVSPKVLIINGGDGSVQAALTELHGGRYFGETPPPVAVLPNGKTNLIALDLGAQGDPLQALERIVELAQSDLAPHIVQRELIALSHGVDSRPVLGMFLGGAGLADSILFCRTKIYPLGLPNGISHVLTALAVIMSVVLGIRAAFLPPRPAPVSVSLNRGGQFSGRFTLLIVTTLERLLLGSKAEGDTGRLKLMAVEQGPATLFRAVLASIRGRLGRNRLQGVHIEQGDEIEIAGERSNVILDGELFEASAGKPIVLRTTPPVPFLKLAA